MQKVKADVTESKNVRMPLSGDTSYAIFFKGVEARGERPSRGEHREPPD